MNTQLIEKRIGGNGFFLNVVDVFSTIQGEGTQSGRLALFVRLAGCNLQCPQCNANYAS